jgi:2-polyprenyl-3-methyl-5-hydroxy-6-metoxy-1,4-benzoquinol methylase
MDLSLYDESYDDFCQLLQKKNASILEIGCGPGNVTKYLLGKRPDYKIHATDAAPSMLALAKINNPTAKVEGDYMQSKLETSSDKQHNMFVHYCSELFISTTLESNHFNNEKIIRIPYPNKNGVQSSHLIFIARKQ